MSIADQLIPVGSLVLGAALQQLSTNSGTRAAARREARELLAEQARHRWTKFEAEGWVDLQVYLGRLRGSLRWAGVTPLAVQRFTDALAEFFEGTEEYDDGGERMHVHGDREVANRLDAALADVESQLDASVWTRRKGRRRT